MLALVVDDSLQSRKKFSAALKSIDVPHESVADGQSALDRLRQGGIDLVLLDILMPGMTGFDVLRDIQADPQLKEIPVLVISSLDQTDDIARALELGAIDFLPKDVEKPIFRARVMGSLEKKRHRDLERQYLEDVSQLTTVAQRMRQGTAEPTELELPGVRNRSDSLGNLARVFVELAHAVHARETKARQRINLLQGSILLLAMGLTWGVVPALSKLLVAPGALNPIGLAAWVAVATLSITTVTLVISGGRPRFDGPALRFGLIAGLFAGVLPQTALFWTSGHLPGVVLSITLALESMIVFAISATLRIEKPSAARLFGLVIGLAAVIIIMFSTDDADGFGVSLWVLAAIIVPLSYGIESLLVASMPATKGRAPLELLFFIMLGSSFWGWSGAVFTGSVINPMTTERSGLILIAAIALMSAISNGCYVLTIRKMGAVFASQYAYVVTVMGVGWSVLLLGERLSPAIWLALLLMMVGIFFGSAKRKVCPAVRDFAAGRGS